MKTKPQTFDAVAASRQWREDAGRRLDAMPLAERMAFLEGLRVRDADGKSAPSRLAACEDEPPYGATGKEGGR